MFERIFVEKNLVQHQRAKRLINFFPHTPLKEVVSVGDIWGRVNRPYLQKRQGVNLFIGQKKGALLREAPSAYGVKGDTHYYFIHAWNCIYECKYCYLQGYFSTPDLVVFVNHEEIGQAIYQRALQDKERGQVPWFHGGEYSDSLALSHLTGEIPFYTKLFKKISWAKLEFRTKSINIKELLACDPLPNVITSFSLSPQEDTAHYDLKAPPLLSRLKAMKKLYQRGHPLACHFDPIIFDSTVIHRYEILFEQFEKVIPLKEMEYISLGILRFSEKSFAEAKLNYPGERAFVQGVPSADGKIRQVSPSLKNNVFSAIEKMLGQRGVEGDKIYRCMEQ